MKPARMVKNVVSCNVWKVSWIRLHFSSSQNFVKNFEKGNFKNFNTFQRNHRVLTLPRIFRVTLNSNSRTSAQFSLFQFSFHDLLTPRKSNAVFSTLHVHVPPFFACRVVKSFSIQAASIRIYTNFHIFLTARDCESAKTKPKLSNSLIQNVILFGSMAWHIHRVRRFSHSLTWANSRERLFLLLICVCKYYFFSGLRLFCMWNNKTMERKVHLNTLSEVSSFKSWKNIFPLSPDPQPWKSTKIFLS